MTHASSSPELDVFQEQIRCELGPALIRTGVECAPYDRDALRRTGRARCVLLPRTREQVSAMLRIAHGCRVGVIAQGARTGLVGAALADASATQCVLSCDRLTRVIDVDTANRSITVEAGMRLSALQTLLAPHGLHLPIDIGSDPSLGGLVASNAGGSRLLKHGGVRRHVLGLEVVLADERGTRVDWLGPLRKNNVGFDTKQLFIASGGSLGVITAVSFDLARRDCSSAAFLVALRDLDAAGPALEAFETAFGDLLAAFEFIDAPSLAQVLRRADRARAPLPLHAGSCHVLVEATSSMPGLDAVLRERGIDVLERLTAQGHTTNAVVDAAADFWRLRHALPAALGGHGMALAFDLGFPRAELVPFIGTVKTWLHSAHPALASYAFGHFGDGGVHLVVRVPPGEVDAYPSARRQALQAAVYALAHRHHGAFSAEHGVGPANFHVYRALTSPVSQRLDGLVQGVFNPRRLLGRCRYEFPGPAS
ncbi:MAG: FAD-binding oxidoreductase [Pseudomonadota bacterium]|nr:FAD-binding oxidoreductase [Pseudomonadota bacterium]